MGRSSTRRETRVFLANGGAARVHRDLAAIDVGAHGGRICLSVVRTAPAASPLRIAVMERHPLGSQAFAPLDGAELLAVVAPEGELDPAAIVAFWARPRRRQLPSRRLAPSADRVGPQKRFVVVDVRSGDNLNLDTLANPLVIDSLLPHAAPRQSRQADRSRALTPIRRAVLRGRERFAKA